MLLNKPRALELMREHDLVAIIGTTHENVTYLTGHVGWSVRVYRQRKNHALMVNDPAAGTDLIVSRSDITYYATYGGFAERTYSYGGQGIHIMPKDWTPDGEMKRYVELNSSAQTHKTLLDALLAALKARGISKGKIALDEEGCGPELFRALKEKLPQCEFIPGSGLFLMIRLVKTEDELQALRAAAQINEDACEAVFRCIRPGVTENEVAEVWRQAVATPGGMWHWFHFNSGSRSVAIFPPTERKLSKGDLFMFDSGLYYQNYNSDTGSCGSLGEPSAQAKREWKAIDEGFHETLSVVKAGVTGGQIYHALVKNIKARWLGFEAVFAGHTIGLEAREFPFILGPETKHNQPFLPATSEIPLPVNSVINIEAPMGTYGFGGYQIEYTIVVKENGWEPILPQKRHFRVIEA